VFKKIYGHCLEPVEGEELWPVSPNPRPQAPEYVRMPGRPKKNNRKREETEKPLGKKMSKHGTIIKCSLCRTSGHNKSGCKSNPNRGKKDKVHLTKKNSNEVCFPYTCKLCFRELKQVSTASYIYINALFVCLYYRELKQVHLELLPQELLTWS
jgi:hypothetical protein